MAVEDAIVETIRAAGYRGWVHTRIVVDEEDVGQGHRLEAQDLKTGERWLIDAATVHEAAVELAGKLGFDLEE